MKKTYIKPIVEVTNIILESHLMAASTDSLAIDPTYTMSNEDALSKEHSSFDIWGEDE